MPISPSSPAFWMTSIGKRLSRSISSAIGRTSPSAKSRARRWMSRCSSVSSNIAAGAYPRRSLVRLGKLLGASEALQELVVERRPVLVGGGRLGRLGELGGRHLARDRGVARALLLELCPRLVELALAGGEQVA